MRFRSFAAFGAIAIAACSEAPVPTAAPMASMGASASLAAESGTYLVAFKGKMPADFANAVAQAGGSVMWAHDGVGLAAIEGISSSAAATLAARRDVAAFEADAYTLLEQPSSVETEDVGTLDALASASNPTLAARYNRQWNMRTIHAAEAWAQGHVGSSSTRVGVLDTGIGYTYVDLQGRIDLAASRSFLSAAENKRVTDAFGANTNLVADLHYHGTHVASTIVTNGLVIAGVTSGIKVVGIKVCSPGFPNSDPTKAFVGSCPTSAVLGGMLYAADIGLDVINMSLGGGFNRRDASAKGGDSPSFLAIINSVFNYVHRKGTAVVVSAGNDSWDLDHNGNGYSTYCDAPHAICVAATGPTSQASNTGPWFNTDSPAYYTNFGRSAITVAAPGGSGTVALVNGKPTLVAATFVTAACSPFTIVTGFTVCQTGTFTLGLQGTSMAAPHVTGLAALIAGQVGHNPDAIAARLMTSADDLGEVGTDPMYGKGRINVAHAMGVSY